MAMRVESWVFCEVEFLRPRALLGISRKGTAKAVSIPNDHFNLNTVITRRSSFVCRIQLLKTESLRR